jgi:hypothetical protein
VRSRRTASGSVTVSRIRRGPAQRAQTKTSIANTRRSSRAQGHRRETGAAVARAAAGDGVGTMADLQRARGARLRRSRKSPGVCSREVDHLAVALGLRGARVRSTSTGFWRDLPLTTTQVVLHCKRADVESPVGRGASSTARHADGTAGDSGGVRNRGWVTGSIGTCQMVR